MHQIFLQNFQKPQSITILDSLQDNIIYPSTTDTLPKLEEQKSHEQEQEMGQQYSFTLEESEYIVHLYKQPVSQIRLPLIKSHILFVVAIPKDSLEQFLDMLSKQWNSQINAVRIIDEIVQNPDSEQEFVKKNKISAVLYFKQQQVAENFYSVFNCHLYEDSKQEAMYLLYINQVRFFTSPELDLKQAIEISQQQQLIQLPNCPACLERIDESNTGLNFQNINNLHIHGKKNRWEQTIKQCRSCKVDDTKCSECYKSNKVNQQQDIWVCMVCYYVGCGRYKSGHSLQHQTDTGHQYSKDISNQRIWDYVEDTFVHRIVKDGEDNLMVNPDNQKHDKEKMETIDQNIWEYCYIMSYQMEEQRKYFEEKIKKQEEVNKLDPKILKKQQILQKNSERINQQRENNEVLQKDIEKLQKQMNVIKQKSAGCEEKIEQVQLFVQSTQENVQQYQENNQQIQLDQDNLPLHNEINKEQKKVDGLNKQFEDLFEKFQAL